MKNTTTPLASSPLFDKATVGLLIATALSIALYLVRLPDIGGVPAHPLIVHLPVVLLPLVAIATFPILFRKVWRAQFSAVLTVVAIVGMAGAILAQSAGDTLREQIGGGDKTVADHADAGTNVAIFSIALVVLLLLVRLVDRWSSQHPIHKSVNAIVRVIAAVAAVLTLVGTIYAGHLGAKAAWEDKRIEQSGYVATNGSRPPHD